MLLMKLESEVKFQKFHYIKIHWSSLHKAAIKITYFPKTELN